MAKETESGRRSPSLIAKLMGLDGFPSSHKKQKRVFDNHQRGSSSPHFSKNSKFHENQTHRKFAMGKQLFKDVYEVKDRLNMETRSNISPPSSTRSYHEDEIGFVRQKFMDAKHFSTNENFQLSKEYQCPDSIELLNSNKDLLLRFLEESDSLFSKHLYDLHDVPKSYYGHILKNNTNSALRRNIDVIGFQISSETSRKIDIRHSDKHSSNCYSKNKDASLNPANIVVLKPNLNKALNISNDSYDRKSRDSRELSGEITRRMKNKLKKDSLKFTSVGKGYSGDESSYYTSENGSSSESELTISSSRTSFNTSLGNKSSTLQHMESSVNREAKKRLSERWKMTNMSRENGGSSKGSTLAEMLAIPDVEIRPRSHDTIVKQEGYFRNFERNDGTSELLSPSGISSRDGRKGGYIQNLSKSRSLPNYANRFGSPKSRSKCEAITEENFLVRKENIGYVRRKPSKRDFRGKDVSLRNKKASDEKFQSSFSLVEAENSTEVQMQASGNPDKNSIDGKDSPKVKNVVLEIPFCRHDTNLALNEEENPSFASPRDCSSSNNTPSLPQVGESPTRNKESNQPSPVSVLEAPFVEDLSSGSECFERVSAELNGLRMQLQLLKQESELCYDEGSILLSSDENAYELTELFDDNKSFINHEECWKSRYLIDVLTLFGIDKIDFDYFLSSWHSRDCPIGPWVFEDLEKRYSEIESCSRLERKLLFDNINAQTMEIVQKFVDMEEPWVKKKGKNVNSQWLKDVVKTELKKVLEKCENEAMKNELDTTILSNMEWMMLEEHTSAIGRDIEVLLIDELVSETFHA